jgi:hypothetical protein
MMMMVDGPMTDRGALKHRHRLNLASGLVATGALLLLGERVEEGADDGDGRADHALGGHLRVIDDEMFSLGGAKQEQTCNRVKSRRVQETDKCDADGESEWIRVEGG